MTDTLTTFARDCRRLAQSVGSEGLRRIIDVVSLKAKTDALDVAGTVLGGDLGARNFAKGRRVGVGYDVTGPGESVIKFRPAGEWVLFDKGAAPHPIGRRRKGKSRRIKVGGDVVMGPVGHPGMAGKRMHTRALAAIEKTFDDNVDQAFTDWITGAF